MHGGSHPGESSRALCSFSFCPLRGTEFLQTHHLPVVHRACCLVYRVFVMCPRYTSQQDFDIRHCRLHGLLLPQKDPKRIAQTLRETSIRDLSLKTNSSVNSASQMVQVMHRARKQFAQGQMLNCWQSQAQKQEYKVPRLDYYHWLSFHCLQSLLDALY